MPEHFIWNRGHVKAGRVNKATHLSSPCDTVPRSFGVFSYSFPRVPSHQPAGEAADLDEESKFYV
ncbi:hypothetical protein E2C01_064576 [Portunus trituberculatus]|uniref:Uncharacterized protein n=1 Tax=Portunus trituberculatus TaxID=210409 RepID=A0A5B7HGH8_PORTR|nr:hypothetical protein [Portunus trituberculatus]